jgi:TetR/AcrR family transcriptional regulator, tetracycline repressor protein
VPRKRLTPSLERPLTPDQVIEAGLNLLDEVGLTSFSTRALAERLGTYPATLYWHVGNRSRLLAAIVDRVLGELALLDPGSVSWQEWLRHGAREYRKVLHRHPNVGPVVATQLTVSVPGIRLVETVLTVLERAGFRGETLADAYNTYVGSLLGWVSLELCANPQDAEQDWYEEFAEAVRTLEPESYPVIASDREHLADALFALRWHGGADRPLDRSFEFALEAWIEGLAAQLG